MTNSKRGFTLIELLVVISIIGLLSSIVLASLATARLKAQDASVRGSIYQLRNVAELAFQANGNYDAVQQIPGVGLVWYKSIADCTSGYSGVDSISIQMRAICNSIVTSGLTSPPGGPFLFTSYNVIGSTYSSAKYSFMAWLPSKKTYLCIGSSGGTSDNSLENAAPGGIWNNPGCYANP